MNARTCFQVCVQLRATRRVGDESKADPKVASIAKYNCKLQTPNVSRRSLLRRSLASLLPLATIPLPGVANTPYFDKYDDYSSTYELLDGTNVLTDALGFTALRSKLVSHAKGNVLEVAIGTGLNLPLYNYNKVSSITGLDLSESMLQQAKQRSKLFSNQSVPIHLVQGRAEHLHFPDDTFDTVVDTFSLCVFPQPLESLREMIRVLKKSPTSTLLLLEHTKSPNPIVAMYQDITAQPTAAMSKGCFPNQNVIQMIESVGCSIRRCEYHLAKTIVYLELGVD